MAASLDGLLAREEDGDLGARTLRRGQRPLEELAAPRRLFSAGRSRSISLKILSLAESGLHRRSNASVVGKAFAPRVVDAIFESITLIRERQRLPILLVEQRVVEALELCDRGYVLEAGRLALSGDRHTLLADQRVQRAYLGS